MIFSFFNSHLEKWNEWGEHFFLLNKILTFLFDSLGVKYDKESSKHYSTPNGVVNWGISLVTDIELLTEFGFHIQGYVTCY